MFVNRQSSSSVLNETNMASLFSESLSAEHEIVLSDEAEAAAGDAASAGILSEFSGVRSELVWHVLRMSEARD